MKWTESSLTTRLEPTPIGGRRTYFSRKTRRGSKTRGQNLGTSSRFSVGIRVFSREGQREMILTESTTIDASDVEKAFTNAQSLRDPKWLSLQHRLTPNDPLLAHLIPAPTKPQAIHGIRQGFPKRMHPVAEAVLVGKMIIDEFRSDGHLRVSRFIPLLFSLSHVAKAAPSIPNIQSRLGRVNTNHVICAILCAWKSPTHSTA